MTLGYILEGTNRECWVFFIFGLLGCHERYEHHIFLFFRTVNAKGEEDVCINRFKTISSHIFNYLVSILEVDTTSFSATYVRYKSDLLGFFFLINKNGHDLEEKQLFQI